MSSAALRGGGGRRSPYRRSLRLRLLIVSGMGAALAALMLVDLMTGPSTLSVADVIAILLGLSDDATAAAIVWSIRLPMTLMAALVGVSLGVAGLQMQTILGNPLASPFTLGFSAAAGFGAAVAIMFGGLLPVPGWVAAPAAAFAMTSVACLMVYAIAHLRGGRPEVLILGGIAVMFLFQALQSFLQFLASPEVLQQIVFWLFGSLMKASWAGVVVVAAALAAALPWLARDSWRLTALGLGDAHARSLGIDVAVLRRRVFVLTALLTAAAVAFVGTIGFIGLVAPHAARGLVGEDQRFLLPLSALAGGGLLLSASIASKVVAQGAVLPVGIVTALVGVPILCVLVMRRRPGGSP